MNEPLVLVRRKGSRFDEVSDRQHLTIRRKHEDLRNAIMEDASLERILEYSSELIVTTLVHFDSEERALRRNPRQCLLAHQALHSEMIANLTTIAEEMEQRKMQAAMDLLKFFDSRLSYHLEVEDTALERELAN